MPFVKLRQRCRSNSLAGQLQFPGSIQAPPGERTVTAAEAGLSSNAVLALAGPEQVGGIAFWAHVGGFVVGVAWALFFRPAREPAARYRIS